MAEEDITQVLEEGEEETKEEEEVKEGEETENG